MTDEPYVEPWWGPVDPNVLIYVRSPSDDVDPFVVQLQRELEVLMNQATLLVAAEDVADRELPHSMYAVVTDDAELAAWVRTWRGNLVTFKPEGGHLVLTGRTTETFGPDDQRSALNFAAAEVSAHWDPPPSTGVTVQEHRQLEVILRAAQQVVVSGPLRDEDRALLQAAVDTFRAQLQSPEPDRMVIGRVLRRISQSAGALIVGVAGNYLTDLLRHFDVPWP